MNPSLAVMWSNLKYKQCYVELLKYNLQHYVLHVEDVWATLVAMLCHVGTGFVEEWIDLVIKLDTD